eukprot:GHVS01095536.1.p1 GENE.GHVS01095536.1~~GHVS01095536.1.p1  ORF type:complete len:106 (+),score=27.94 GHVS01095536.1:598-915(+)
MFRLISFFFPSSSSSYIPCFQLYAFPPAAVPPPPPSQSTTSIMVASNNSQCSADIYPLSSHRLQQHFDSAVCSASSTPPRFLSCCGRDVNLSPCGHSGANSFVAV